MLSSGKGYKEKLQDYEKYFDLKIDIEEKTEKYPFHRDEGIRSILASRLRIFKEKAMAAAAASSRKKVFLPSATFNQERKLTIKDTLLWLDDLKALHLQLATEKENLERQGSS